MAYVPNTNNNVASKQNDSWKSDAFLNIYLPTKEGGRRKIGAIGLKNSKAYEAAIITRLTEGGDGAVAAMAAVIEIDFQLANVTVDPADLGF